jgi:hypothetical protein
MTCYHNYTLFRKRKGERRPEGKKEGYNEISKIGKK